MNRAPTPIPLRNIIDASALAHTSPVDDTMALGSYWVRTAGLDTQSALVRYFKDNSMNSGDPCILQAVFHAYAHMIAEMISPWNPVSIVRVLSSSETQPDPIRPLAFLTDKLCSMLRLTDCTNLFFRTEPRKPMRMIDRLSGTRVLNPRISYVSQDMFILPRSISGPVVILDDIFNLGATASVYAAALKQFCNATTVYSANISIARFSGGHDGWGMLHLDIDKFAGLARTQVRTDRNGNPFDIVWTTSNPKSLHVNEQCAHNAAKAYKSLKVFAQNDYQPCSRCTK